MNHTKWNEKEKLNKTKSTADMDLFTFFPFRGREEKQARETEQTDKLKSH